MTRRLGVDGEHACVRRRRQCSRLVSQDQGRGEDLGGANAQAQMIGGGGLLHGTTAARFTIVWSTATTLSRRQVSVRGPDSLFDTSPLTHLCSLTSEHSVFCLPTVGFHYLPSSGHVCELTSRFLRSCNSSHIQKRCFWVSFSNQTSYVSTPT